MATYGTDLIGLVPAEFKYGRIPKATVNSNIINNCYLPKLSWDRMIYGDNIHYLIFAKKYLHSSSKISIHMKETKTIHALKAKVYPHLI